MIGRLADKVIAAISPESGLRRTQARIRFEALNRQYDGAKTDSLNSNWRPTNRSADLELLGDADKIRARARDLVRNNAYAKGMVRARARNVVGCGIYPQSRATGKAFVKAAELEFERWQKQADITGRLSFYEIQWLAMEEVDEAGECIVHFVRSSDRSRRLPFALELIEADRICGESVYARGINPANGNEVRRGVEVDKTGRPVAYHVYERNPADLNSYSTTVRRLPAEECVHLFRQERIGQTRGVSIFAPVLIWLHHLRNYMDSEQKTKAISSKFGVLIKSLGGPADAGLLGASGDSTTDTNGNTFDHLEDSFVARLFPGEDVSVVDPGRSEAGAEIWITLMLRSLAVGSGLSYERLTRDYSKTNYSSNRASDLEDRREFRPLQEMLIRQLCEPVWRKFLAAAVEAGLKGFPTPNRFIAQYESYTDHVWQAPGWEWVDPVKEAAGDVLAIEKGLMTYADALGRRGKDWRETFDQRKVEQDYADEIGLSISAENVIPLATAVVEAEEKAAQKEQANEASAVA